MFAKSKQNKTLSLKDSQLNRRPDYYIRTFYLIDDIASYLKKSSDILNNVAIIDCNFAEIEILKPVIAAITLLGLHITCPIHCLLMKKEKTYSDLLYSFAQLHKDLTEIDAKEFLKMDQICKFTSHKVFFESLTKEEFLIESLRQSITMHPQEIEKLIRLALLIYCLLRVSHFRRVACLVLPT